MFESSLSQLLSAWKDTHQESDAKTLSGLLKAVEELPEDPDKRHLIQTDAPVLLTAIQNAIFETERDLANLPEYSPLLDIYQVALTAYDLAEVVLEEIVSDDGSLPFESLADDLKMAAGELKRSQDMWARWMSDSTPRCACCGHTSNRDTECPDCGADLLRPDSRSMETIHRRQAVLGPEYLQAYQTYLKLQDGEVRLTTFHQTLAPIQRNANSWRAVLRQISPTSLPDESYQTLVAATEQTISGANLISGAIQTRQWSHINDGWNSIFQAAADIQLQLPALYRALGSENQAQELEQDMRVRDLV